MQIIWIREGATVVVAALRIKTNVRSFLFCYDFCPGKSDGKRIKECIQRLPICE